MARNQAASFQLLELHMNDSKTPRKSGKSSESDDALVGVPSHPVATGVGALAGGAAAGAAAGTVVGPVGTVVGAVVGAAIGGLGGDAIAESASEARDDSHWRERFSSRPYVVSGDLYDDFAPAYELAERSHSRLADSDPDEVEAAVAREWSTARGGSRLTWERARLAVRDGWDQLNGDDDDHPRSTADERVRASSTDWR
jgi:hypothetical protein